LSPSTHGFSEAILQFHHSRAPTDQSRFERPLLPMKYYHFGDADEIQADNSTSP
jgi:hypothetical protein